MIQYEDDNVAILQGDCVASMKELPDGCVNTCVTSPPYFGLRDYGHAGQIGLEETPDAYVAEMVAVFREVKRVLRNDGTLWLNLGDSYYHANPSGPQGKTGSRANRTFTAFGAGGQRAKPCGTYENGGASQSLKQKDLIGIPWRVAFALQADGWYLRQDIIWHKPNPMPESVRDRCTKAHEYIFLLSKSARYWYDAEAVKEASSEDSGFARQRAKGINTWKYNDTEERIKQTRQNIESSTLGTPGTRNKRSVWSITAKPFKGAHFATFPPDLIEPCILAGCPVGGTVLDPFGGSGTTAKVAVAQKKRAILCELNPEYIELMLKRIYN